MLSGLKKLVIVALATLMLACPQPTEHLFDLDELIPKTKLTITAGGTVRLQWTMEWRDFDPKLIFHLGVADERKLACKVEGINGEGANGARWIGLVFGRDCPGGTVKLRVWVDTVASAEVLVEDFFDIELAANQHVSGMKDEFSPPDGYPTTRNPKWRVVNNFAYGELLSMGEEALMKKGRLGSRCAATPPAPPAGRNWAGWDPDDMMFTNCLGGQAHAIIPVSISLLPPPKPKPEGSEKQSAPPPPPPPPPELPKPECTFDFGGPANEDENGYRPRSGHMVLSYNFPDAARKLGTEALVGCRYREYFKGPRPRPGQVYKKKKKSMPMSRDLRKYNKFSFMGRAAEGDDAWVTVSLAYWSETAPKPKESLAIDYQLSEEWKRFEVNLDTEFWLDQSNLKEMVGLNFDVFKTKISCDGGLIVNSNIGAVELTNFYLIARD